jgi:hypothetical protein
LLKVVSLVVGSLVLGLLVAIAALATFGEDSAHGGFGFVFVPILLIPGFFVFRMIADSFSVLEVDEKGVRVRKWIGGTALSWEEIGSARFWEVLQMVHGATSRECFFEFHSKEGKRLLRLKSSYESEAYQYLIESTRERGVPVYLGRA